MPRHVSPFLITCADALDSLQVAARRSCVATPSAAPPTAGLAAAGAASSRPAIPAVLGLPLPFVNRSAEAIDVMWPNMRNQLSLARNARQKAFTPLAGQPAGTGKTELGCHLADILNRPRELDDAAEAALASRLKTSWSLSREPHWLDAALRDSRSDNLVVRTLLAAFGADCEATILQLKTAPTIVIVMKLLDTSAATLAIALSYAIYCAAAKYAGVEAVALPKYASAGTLALLVDALIKAADSPLILVLDDIVDLGDHQFKPWFGSEPDRLYSAMKALNMQLQVLHSIRRCIVYCTGKSPWLSTLARASVGPPLFVRPVLLQPLSAGDIERMLEVTTTPHPLDVTTTPAKMLLMHDLGVNASLARLFAERVQQATGGVGRVLQYALRARQQEFVRTRKPIESPADVESALVAAHSEVLAQIGSQLTLTWDGPVAADTSLTAGQWAARQLDRRRALQLIAHLLLLDAPFHPAFAVQQGASSMPVVDVATALGLSYTPATISLDSTPPTVVADVGVVFGPANDAAAEEASGAVAATPAGTATAAAGAAAATTTASAPAVADSATAAARTASATTEPPLRLVAGEWLCDAILHDPAVTGDPSALCSAQMLAVMRTFGGTMRGRPFELLCCHTLCFRSAVRPGQPLCTLLPHLSSTSVASSRVPRLRVVALPKVVSTAATLTVEQKRIFAATRQQWPGPRFVHPDDMPWILSTWLEDGTLAIPADAASGSQDAFVKLDGRVIGIAFKAVSAGDGTAWADLQSEIKKAPALDSPYTLVVWSLVLAPELQAALRDCSARVIGPGKWKYDKAGRDLVQCELGAPSFSVHVRYGMELVVANPHPTQGGLRELLGADTWRQLLEMSGKPRCALEIKALAEWMAQPSLTEVVPLGSTVPRSTASAAFASV